jgi:hypothetical protein
MSPGEKNFKKGKLYKQWMKHGDLPREIQRSVVRPREAPMPLLEGQESEERKPRPQSNTTVLIVAVCILLFILLAAVIIIMLYY